MIALNAKSEVFIAIEPVDFRNGILGLKSICKEYLKQKSDSGTFYIFRNKRKTCIKILVYDGQGYWLMMKRLSRGKFPWWPQGTSRGTHLDHKKFQLIINAANDVTFSEDWKRLY